MPALFRAGNRLRPIGVLLLGIVLMVVLLLMTFNGFSLVGIRLWVMVGWLTEILLIYEMGKQHLSKSWMGLFLVFLWIADVQFPMNRFYSWSAYFWSGFSALVAVYFAWRYLPTVYAGKIQHWLLVGCGVFCSMCFWMAPSAGIMISIGLGLFGLLHCFLHEREEKGVTYRQVSNREVFKRWGQSWGVYWALPTLAFHGVCIAILLALGSWSSFWRDLMQGLVGEYSQYGFGYFTTFSQEVNETLRPLMDGAHRPDLLLALFRIPIALNLFLIGLLPVLGILSTGYLLPNRFVYRLLQRGDEELLLLWVSALCLVLSSMIAGTSMHLVSNGGLAFLLGWLAMARWFAKRPKLECPAQVGMAVFLFIVMLGFVLHSAT